MAAGPNLLIFIAWPGSISVKVEEAIRKWPITQFGNQKIWGGQNEVVSIILRGLQMQREMPSAGIKVELPLADIHKGKGWQHLRLTVSDTCRRARSRQKDH